jgi:hypothetical protein
MIDIGLVRVVHGVVRWRLTDLVRRHWGEFRVSVSRQTLDRRLHAAGYAEF